MRPSSIGMASAESRRQVDHDQERRGHHRVLLALLIAAWAISWPAIKVGVLSVPPLWYACFRYWIATFCMFALLVTMRQLAIPARSDWSLIAVSGVLQMAAYSALTGLALTILPPGRASVLAFSTPIWSSRLVRGGCARRIRGARCSQWGSGCWV